MCYALPMDYMTAEDKERLQVELKRCSAKRREIIDRIAAARELGDLKENAEYHAAREDQGMNEARIRLLEERLSNAVVTETDSVPDDVVFVGMTVKLRDVASGNEDLYRIVGEASGRFDLDYLEVTPQSPMGEALMKARVGDVVRVALRKGENTFEMVETL